MLGLLHPQPDHGDVGDGERQHRPERVHRPKEPRLAGKDREAGDRAEDQDRDVGRPEAWVELPQALGQLTVLSHRVRQAGHPDEPCVGRDEEDRGGEDPDVHLGGSLERAEVQVLHDAQDRIARELASERRVAVHHRHRGQRDDRQERVDHCDRDDDAPYRARDRPAEVARLLGEVGHGLDSRVRHHPDRDRDQEVADRGRGPEVDVVDKRAGREHQHAAEDHEHDLRQEVCKGEEHVQPGRLAHPDHVHGRK